MISVTVPHNSRGAKVMGQEPIDNLKADIFIVKMFPTFRSPSTCLEKILVSKPKRKCTASSQGHFEFRWKFPVKLPEPANWFCFRSKSLSNFPIANFHSRRYINFSAISSSNLQWPERVEAKKSEQRSVFEQARKLGRSPKSEITTHWLWPTSALWLTGVGARRCYRI